MTSRDFAISFLALSVVSVCSLMGRAQTLPIGSVEALTPLNVCPSGFYLGPAGNQTQCYEATINCPNTNYINVTFGYLAPTPDLGTVVFFSEGGGTSPSTPTGQEEPTAELYYNDHYAVVQSEWSWDWEDTNGPVPKPTYPYNVLTAACRPATFLNFIGGTNGSGQFHPSGTAMCAQGTSAGSAAIAYPLVWYGLGSQLNDVELLSGPPLSDIELGCQVGNNPTTCSAVCESSCSAPNICGTQTCTNGSTFGCTTGTKNEVGVSPWYYAPQYVSNYLSDVQEWTGNLSPSCNNSLGQSTGGVNPFTMNNAVWKSQSIVTGTGGTFGYPSSLDGMAGWACYSSSPCTGACPNNSAEEGEQFFNQFGVSTAPVGYSVSGIQACYQAEGVDGGTDPDTKGPAQYATESHVKSFCVP